MNKENLNILIVDDDPDYLLQLETQVKSFGFNVITADGQKEAEEIIKDNKPDLCIYDLMMEEQDSGFVLAYKTKKLYPELPIIIATAVTSDTGYKFKDEADKHVSWIKADLMLEKGIRADQLHREINRLLKL